MPAEKTIVDAVLPQAPEDLEDTFRTGPPGSLPTVQTDDILDDAGPTAEDEAPKLKLARPQIRVVEKVREAEKPAPPPKAEPKKIAHAPIAHAPIAVVERSVGVDPAVFPIHRSAPQAHLGQRVILGLVGALIAIISIAFAIGGETKEERAMRRERQERSVIAIEQEARIEQRRKQRAATRTVHAPKTADGTRGEHNLYLVPSRKPVRTHRPTAHARRMARKAFQFSDGKVAQPNNYGDHPEHIRPPGVKPVMIVMSVPQALVYRDGKLIGATPYMVPVEEDTPATTVTLKTMGYKEQTVEVKPGRSGNLEASVALEKDPAFEGRTVITKETPKS
jgi:hypothetical protein